MKTFIVEPSLSGPTPFVSHSQVTCSCLPAELCSPEAPSVTGEKAITCWLRNDMMAFNKTPLKRPQLLKGKNE